MSLVDKIAEVQSAVVEAKLRPDANGVLAAAAILVLADRVRDISEELPADD